MRKKSIYLLLSITIIAIITICSCSKDYNDIEYDINQNIDLRTSCLPTEFVDTSICIGPRTYNALIDIPNDSCTVSIELEYYWCTNRMTNEVEVLFGDFNTVTFEDSCYTFVLDAIDIIANGTQAQQEIFFTDFYNDLYDGILENFIESRYDSIPELSECGGLTPNNFSIQFSTKSCFRVCIAPEQPIWSKVYCGNQCCLRRTEYCVDPVTEDIEVTESFEEIGSCGTVGFQQCPVSGSISTICFSTCN